MPTMIKPHDLRRLATAADLEPRTVARFLRGDDVRPSTRTLVTRAARELGIPLASQETAAA